MTIHESQVILAAHLFGQSKSAQMDSHEGVDIDAVQESGKVIGAHLMKQFAEKAAKLPLHLISSPPKLYLVPVLDGSSKGTEVPEKEKKMPKATSLKRMKEYLGPDKEIEPDVLSKYENGSWIIEPKIDGMWCMLTVGSPKDGVPHVLTSRDARTSALSGSSLGDLHTIDLPLPVGSIIVGELESATQYAKEKVTKQGYRRLHLFDVVRAGQNDMRGLKWYERRAWLDDLGANLQQEEKTAARFPVLPYQQTGFRDYYDHMVACGEEGVVLKNKHSTYITNRSDGKTDLWLRCKRWVTEDYVLMGVTKTPGGAYSLPQLTGVWGLYSKGKLVPVLQASAGPTDVHLNPDNFGKVVAEFMGWARFKSGALRHAQFVRLRSDKQASECVL